MATVRKRGAYQWQAIVRRKGFPQQSKTFETRKDAEAWARKIEREIETGTWRDSREAESTTLFECLERYINEVSIHKKGYRQEVHKANVIARHPVSSMFMASIRGADIAKFRDARLKDGKAASTIQKELALLSHLFNTARREWSMESISNPVQFVRKPKVDNARNRRLEGDEEQRLLKACSPGFHNSNIWLLPLVILAIETAMRKSELLALEWKDIDFEGHVLKSKNKDPKGNAPYRFVPLTPHAMAVLTSLPRSIDGRVFQTTDNAIKLAFPRACNRADIKNLHFHDLRHEATSRLFEQGLSTEEVMSITGHKTYQMLRRYTHLRTAENTATKFRN